MFGIGWTEFVLVALVVLIFVGPKHLPDMLKKFGRIVGELRSASRDLRNQLDIELNDLESPSKIMGDVARDVTASIPSPYDAIHKAEEELKRETRDIADETTKPPPDTTSKPQKDPT